MNSPYNTIQTKPLRSDKKNCFAFRPRALCSALLLIFTFAAQASPVDFYVCSNDKSLGIVSWNTDNAALTKSYSSIGTMSYRMSDIAILPDGRLFGISQPGTYAASSALFQINPNNASVTLIGDTGLSLNALTYDVANSRLLTAGNGVFASLNLATGANTTIGNLSGANSAGDLAFYNGNLYLSVSQISSKFYSVNPANGSAALVGSIGYDNVFGMDVGSDNHLYAFKQSYAFEINAATGERVDVVGGPQGALFSLSSMGGVDGVTAVPEPTTSVLIGLAGVAFALSRVCSRK